MITGLNIKNFRGLRDVSLDGLARVNVIVGENGSGKTSFLEAIYLTMSSASRVALQLRQFRGLPGPGSPLQTAIPEAFFEFIAEGADEVGIDTRGSGKSSRSLRVSRDPARSLNLASGASTATTGTIASTMEIGTLPASNLAPSPVVFRWKDADGREGEAVVQSGAGGIAFSAADVSTVAAHFIGEGRAGQGSAPTLFSALDSAGKSAIFVQAMQAQFPDVDTISLQLEGGQTLLFARIKGQKRQRPIEAHSAGLTHLATLLLTLATLSIRVVLIDEIEYGLHHSRLRLLWQQVRDFADRFDTQVFATTHSLECLDGAAAAMTEHPDDFALVRMTRFHGDCVARLLPGQDAGELLRSPLEIRG